MLKRHVDVTSPKSSANPERDVDCLFALMPAFRHLVHTAKEAGWTEDEVATCLLTLASIHENRPAEHAGLWH
jgi:hypothetical protein